MSQYLRKWLVWILLNFYLFLDLKSDFTKIVFYSLYYLEIEEEVIAEDYDDNEKTTDGHQNGIDPGESNELKEPWIGCPNKWNIYHDCTKFCKEHWGSGKEQPSPKTEKKRLYMLKRYPLPEGWEEVYDSGM